MNRLFLGVVLISSPCLLLAQEENSTPKLVAVRIAILESNTDLELKNGASLSVDGVNELIANLRKQNSLERYQFFNFTSPEDQEAMFQSGEEEPAVTGITAQGRVQEFDLPQTGTKAKVKPRVRDDGKIFLELLVESRRLTPPARLESEARDESRPLTDLPEIDLNDIPGIETRRINTTKLVESGVNTVIASLLSKNGEETSHAYFIVFATAK